MAKGGRFKKYSRRTSRANHNSRVWLILLIVAAFLVLCFVISVIIGLALGKKAEEQANKPKLDVAVDTYYSGNRQVKQADAQIYGWDFDISGVWNGKADFSVCLQDPSGNMAYDPQLGVRFDNVDFGEESLAEHVGYIKDYGGYVCAYIYVSAFDAGNQNSVEIVRAFEKAIVKQASANGVDEILLILPQITDSNIESVERYVSDMSNASEEAAVGVLLPEKLYRLAENGVYYASRLRAVCDFAALDLREATEENIEAILTENEYYIKSYALRAVFCKENSKISALARELGITSTQIIEK